MCALQYSSVTSDFGSRIAERYYKSNDYTASRDSAHGGHGGRRQRQQDMQRSPDKFDGGGQSYQSWSASDRLERISSVGSNDKDGTDSTQDMDLLSGHAPLGGEYYQIGREGRSASNRSQSREGNTGGSSSRADSSHRSRGHSSLHSEGPPGLRLRDSLLQEAEYVREDGGYVRDSLDRSGTTVASSF
jgi:hypothetical protein